MPRDRGHHIFLTLLFLFISLLLTFSFASSLSFEGGWGKTKVLVIVVLGIVFSRITAFSGGGGLKVKDAFLRDAEACFLKSEFRSLRALMLCR